MFRLYVQLESLFERLADYDAIADDNFDRTMDMAIHDPHVELPLPQLSWTFCGVMERYRRQKWAYKVYSDRLEHQFGRPGLNEAFVTREVPVPRLSEWTYTFSCLHSSISNENTGEWIGIDFERGPNVMGTGDLAAQLERLKFPNGMEQRLRQLFPRGGAVGGNARTCTRATKSFTKSRIWSGSS